MGARVKGQATALSRRIAPVRPDVGVWFRRVSIDPSVVAPIRLEHTRGALGCPAKSSARRPPLRLGELKVLLQFRFAGGAVLRADRVAARSVAEMPDMARRAAFETVFRPWRQLNLPSGCFTHRT